MSTDVKTVENGSYPPGLQAKEEQTTSIDSEQNHIKECQTLPAFIRYGYIGCLNSYPIAGHCLFGNEVGDEYCQRDRKLNLRATDLCVQKGCISAVHVENGILVCAHNAPKCDHVDRLDNCLGELIKTRTIREVIDSDKANESLRVVAALKARHERPRIQEVAYP